MKNIIITILLLAVVNLAIGQSRGPVRSAKSKNSKNERRKGSEKINKKDDDQVITAQSKFYIQVKVTKTDDYKINELSRMNLDKYKNSKNEDLLNEFNNLKEEVSQKHYNVLLEFGLKGYRLVSHNFAFYEESEVHYYIFEY